MKGVLRHLVRLLLLGVGIVALVWLVRAAGWEEIRGLLGKLGWGLGLFLLPSLGVHLCEALGWWCSFRERPPVGFFRLLLVRVAGESLNNTLPSAYLGGEPFKAMLLSRAGGSGMEALASVIVAKTALTVAQVASVLLGVVLALTSRAGGQHLGAMAAGSFVCAILGAWAVWGAYVGQREGLGKLLARLIERTGIGRGFLERRREALERLDTALTGFYARRGGRFWLASGWCFLGWLLEGVEVVLFAHLVGLRLDWVGAMAIGLLFSVPKAAGMLIPGSLGAQEGGATLLFRVYGLGMAPAMAYALARRARELLWVGVGFALLALLGVSPRRVAEGATSEVLPAAEPVA